MNKNTDERICVFGSSFFHNFFFLFCCTVVIVVVFLLRWRHETYTHFQIHPTKKSSAILKTKCGGRNSKWHVSNFINGIYFDNINKWVLSRSVSKENKKRSTNTNIMYNVYIVISIKSNTKWVKRRKKSEFLSRASKHNRLDIKRNNFPSMEITFSAISMETLLVRTRKWACN